ncbi:metallophosphoesterase family protein [Sphingobacterium sp. SYP-B4668]|uniref:metallophosphoesterase family protein n=1 Tax=Sphingobacterium sp. SYP-B4668 TaxID=2996035 RepID=UPI0022DDC602|nr:metallophosphoesterase [Sphingobacterium sp. SYP-B4668]
MKVIKLVWITVLFYCSIPSFAQQAQENFSFVFMTDVHLKNEPHIISGFRRAMDKINVLDPDFILSGGDQVFDVMRGNEAVSDSLFQLYANETKALRAPVYNCIGNHELFGIYKESPTDSTHRLYKYGLYKKYFEELYYSFDYKGWHFVVLNNLDAASYAYFASFDQQQLDWLKNDLSNISPSTPVVIMMHVPIVSVQNQLDIPQNGVSMGPNIRNRDVLLEMIEPYNIQLVLQGHLHYFEDIQVKGKTRFITGSAIAGRPSWRGQRNGPPGFLKFEVTGSSYTYKFVEF